MRYLSILLVATLFWGCNQQASAPKNYTEIPWLTLEEAQKQASKKPRKILVDVYTPWCGPCKMMDRKTFTDPKLVNYIGNNYYAVKFNGESPESIDFGGKTFGNPNYNPNLPNNRRNSMHEFTRHLGLRGYPTLFVFDAKLNQVTQAVGFKTAEQLMEVLKEI